MAKTTTKRSKSPVEAYAQGVVKGKIPAGKPVRQACERHLLDLKAAKARGLYWDEQSARRAIKFFKRFLRHTLNEWQRCAFELEPWQQFIVGSIFGWKKTDGNRRFTTAYVEIPRKNGKTTLAAGIGLYLLVADGEPGAEVYSAATTRKQAKKVFDEADRMVKLSPELKDYVDSHRNNLSVEETFSSFEPLGGDHDVLDGLNAHGAIIDELHAHKDRGLWDVLVTATGARRSPLIFAITTAGLGGGESICLTQHDYGLRILDKVFDDDSYFAYIATIDEGDDWANPKTWAKANPNLGVSCKLEVLKKDCKTALEDPSFQNTFRRYHLNEWVQQETRWMPLKAWDSSAGIVHRDKLAGRKCFGGLDLASSLDIASLELVFPIEKEEDSDELYEVLSFFWIPKDNMLERARKARVPYDVWAKQSLIKATPGDVIDYETIQSDIIALNKVYQIVEIGHDPWSAVQITQNLAAEGITCVPIQQTFKGLGEGTKEVMRLVLSRRLKHGGNKVLRWMADNVVVDRDSNENIKPNKKKSREKIDGMVALVMAIDRAMRHAFKKKKSIYEKRGVRTV